MPHKWVMNSQGIFHLGMCLLVLDKNISCQKACNTENKGVILIHGLLLSESKLEGHRTEREMSTAYLGALTGSVLKVMKREDPRPS